MTNVISAVVVTSVLTGALGFACGYLLSDYGWIKWIARYLEDFK